MLLRLEIENVAVIDRAEIAFDSGFHVLTGETGAGKSIIIDSIELVLGERASRDMIRTGSAFAGVFAEFTDLSPFTVSLLKDNGYLPEEDGSLIISREIQSDGRSSARINGRPVNVSVLREIGRSLINIHGQHNNQSLLDPDTHVVYLDSYAGNEVLIEDYKKTYRTLNILKNERNQLLKLEKEKAGKIDYLTFQIDEIEKAGIYSGEDDELSEQKSLLANAEKLSTAAEEAYFSLYTREDSAESLISQSVHELESTEHYTKRFSPIANRLKELQYELKDSISELRTLKDELDFNPKLLEETEERLDVFHRLKRKYGNNADEILAFLDNAKNELEEIEFSGEKMKKIEEKVKIEEELLLNKADAITKSRTEAAENLCGKILKELRFLNMPKVQFDIKIEPAGSYNETGADNVEFFISTNTGEQPRPLSKVASGGELSRIMLSIKNVLSEEDPVKTLIFDEIDSGVSGGAAQKIGLKLKEVSKGRQIICVTHLAQIAAFADRHLLVTKDERDKRTFTFVKTLDRQGREEELARIMGGIDMTENLMSTAAELIDASSAMTK